MQELVRAEDEEFHRDENNQKLKRIGKRENITYVEKNKFKDTQYLKHYS